MDLGKCEPEGASSTLVAGNRAASGVKKMATQIFNGYGPQVSGLYDGVWAMRVNYSFYWHQLP